MAFWIASSILFPDDPATWMILYTRSGIVFSLARRDGNDSARFIAKHLGADFLPWRSKNILPLRFALSGSHFGGRDPGTREAAAGATALWRR